MNRPKHSPSTNGPHFSAHPRHYHLAQSQRRLTSACKQLACQAAAMYLLDEGTSELQLYATVGDETLQQQLATARTLAASIGDLEALCGHAVVMEQPNYADLWNAPITNVCGICVPIASRKTIWGTLWLFKREAQAFGDEALLDLELIAAQLAEDWERELVVQQFRSVRQ